MNENKTIDVLLLIAGLYISYKIGSKVGYNDALKDVVKVVQFVPKNSQK